MSKTKLIAPSRQRNIKSQISNIKYIWIALFAIICTSCDNLVKQFVDTSDFDILSSYIEPDKTGMEVTDVSFSPDYKTFSVSTKLIHEGPGFKFTDTTLVRTEVKEVIDGIRQTIYTTPHLVEMTNVEAEEVKQHDLRMLLLVDKTLPQEELNKIQKYVREMRTIFDPNHLYVSFMDGQNVSKNLPCTDYITDAYFKHSDQSYIYLYRAMQTKSEEMRQRQDVWKDAHRCAMIIFANEQPYDENSDIPYDPDHFLYEEKLVKQSAPDTMFFAYYVNVDESNAVSEEEAAQTVPYIFCHNTGGEYISNYNWIALKRMIYGAFHFDFPDNRFTFVNPDFKVYRGDDKQLTLNIYNRKTDKLVISFSTTVTLGHPYKPIIVHGHSIVFVLIQGTLLGLFIFLLVYFIMQVVVPLIRYLIFRHKYVFEYTGSNMSVHNHAVGETCYLCKAPFQPGDKIVVKCEHTMHEQCWEENDYHCPEYSDRCKHGSHYFNKYSLFDVRNASFYMRWTLMAIIASIIAWFELTLNIHYNMEQTLPHFLQIADAQLPFFGFVMSLCLTFGLSILTVIPRNVRGWGGVLLRTLVASLVSYIAFFITQLFNSVLNISLLQQIASAIPWILSSFVIVVCSTKYTRVAYSRKLVILSVVIGLLSMIVWNIFYQLSELDYRVMLLFSFLFYYVSMAVSVATVAPRSERYFLKVEGAVKTMDVALYKWFRNHSNRVVTIGKSVDCSLQLSWDVQSNVAPVQAEIRLIHKVPYLIALEPGVFIRDKQLKPSHKVRLHHGKQFIIGQTTFTYVEKDH